MVDDAGKVIWFELYADDLHRAATFYQELLGWTFEPFAEYQPDKYLLIRTRDNESVKGGLVARTATPEIEPSSGNSVVMYIAVDDLAHTLALARKLGGRVLVERKKIGPSDGFFGLLEDTEGNVVGMWAEN